MLGARVGSDVGGTLGEEVASLGQRNLQPSQPRNSRQTRKSSLLL